MTQPPEPALYERDAEIEVIRRAVEAAAAGNGSAVVIEGEAGVGKTTLLDVAAVAAHEHGMRVLRARGAVLERDFAFGIARQLFEATLVSATAAERRSLLRGPAAAAATPLGLAAHGSPVGSADLGFAGRHGLYWLSANLAAQSPMLLVVDDAQWADAASLHWLAYLAHGRLAELPIGVVVGWRSGEPHASQDVLRTLLAEPGVVHVLPRPLSRTGSGELLKSALGGGVADDELCQLCHERTDGNPFLLVELARALAGEATETPEERRRIAARLRPDTIRHAVLLRLAALPRDGVALARAVAVLDSDAAARHAAELAGLSPEQADAQAALLGAAGVLAAGATLRFTHPIVRAVVYEDMPASVRSAAHARAADVLAAAGAAEQGAVHLLRTDPRAEPAVVRLLREVAARHVANGAPRAAAALLQRALAEPPPAAERGAVLAELGYAEMLAGRTEAIARLREAYGCAEEPAMAVTVARHLAGTLAQAGRPDEALDLLRRLAERVAPDEELALSVEADAAAVAQVSGQLRGRHAERLRSVADRASGQTPAGRRLLVAYAYGAMATGSLNAREVAALLDRASPHGEIFDDEETSASLSPSLPWMIAGEVAVDRLDRAEADATRELDRARERGSPLGVLTAAGFVAHIAYLRADLHTAEADARLALQAAEAIAPTYYFDWPVSRLALVLVERGDPDQALAVLEQYGCAGETLPRATFAAHLLVEARLATWLALGRLDRAEADATAIARMGRGRVLPLLVRRGLVVEALLAAGRLVEAAEAASADLDAAERWGTGGARCAAWRALAAVRRDEAVELLRRSLAELDGTPHRLEHTRALVDLGVALRHGRQPAAAREALQRAYQVAEQGGAVALAERARAELLVAGARPLRRETDAAETLTAAERRVAELVAAGHGNDSVAAALFVTRRTVETHLTSVYRKLGVKNRVMLAEALRQVGSTG